MTKADRTEVRARRPAAPSRRIARRVAVAATGAALLLPVLPISPASATSSAGVAATDSHHRQPAEVALPKGLRPEGITSGRGSTYYVGSLADGRIVTGDLRRGTSKVLLPGAQGRQLRGLYFDRRTGLVWAAGNVGTTGHVWAVDGRTGRVVQDTVVKGAVFLNDLVVTRSAVWVTDSRVDRLTVIALGRRGKPTGAKPTFLALRGDWPRLPKDVPVAELPINANGIRQLPDGSAILNNSEVGGLWQVNPRTGKARRIPVKGGPGITGGDGLELSGSTLYNVRGSGQAEVSVLKLRHDRKGWSAQWRGALTDERLDVPSTATLVGRTLWAVNARFGTPDPGTADYWITPLRTEK